MLRPIGNRAKVLAGILTSLFVVMGVGLIGISPVALNAFNGATGKWERLSFIGQTYGAASAVISVLALVGIVLTLSYQAREVKLAREETRRQAISDLLKMAMEDPDLDECWGPVPPDDDVKERKQLLYTNMIVSEWTLSFETGALPERRLRAVANEMFQGQVGRKYWQSARELRLSTSAGRAEQRFHEILDEEYERARPLPGQRPSGGRTSGAAPYGVVAVRRPDDPVSEVEAGSVVWGGRRVVDGGVVERSLVLERPAGVVPGMLWLPPSYRTAPGLVLLGHGGSQHKTSGRIVGLARWFGRNGLAALAIDGPYHGDRVPHPMDAAEYQPLIAEEGIDAVLDRMAGDWRATVDALGALGIVDTVHLAYLGLSMATRFGLPLAATLGDRLRAVVLGKFGLRQSPALPPGLDAPARVTADARRITAPALFHIQWDDELFPRDGQLALFEALGSPDKQLIAYRGRHGETTPTAIACWRGFITRHLACGRP